MNCLRLQYIGWNKLNLSLRSSSRRNQSLLEPSVREYHFNIVSPCNQQKSSSFICPGRPKFDINREQLEYFLFYDPSVQDIADALTVSKTTVQRRFREFLSSAMSQQANDQLRQTVSQVKNDFPNAGYRRVDSN